MASNHILIVGSPKSGTTALYFFIKNSFSRNIKCYFEPNTYIKEQGDENRQILSKILITPELNYDSFLFFNKKIFIHRDPRDQFISKFLYLIGFHFFELKIDENSLKNIYSMLKQKERDPSAISFRDLFFYFHSVSSHNLNEFQLSLDFIAKYKDFFYLGYEEFCLGHLQNLENFLQMRLSAKKEVDTSYSRVVRTRSFGAWRNWYTESDIDFFKPIFKEYMIEFNYDFNDWKLNQNQIIHSKYCSGYFIDILNQRRKMLNLKPLCFS